MDYQGESSSAFSFFTSFPEIIFRWHGSVLPKIWIEVALATAVGLIAAMMVTGGPLYPDGCHGEYTCIEEARPTGHTTVGVLAFLSVFRSQISFLLYKEGRDALGNLTATIRALQLEVLVALATAALSGPRRQRRRQQWQRRSRRR